MRWQPPDCRCFRRVACFFALNVALIGYYQSIAKAAASTLLTLLRGVLFLVPSFLLLPEVMGVVGLWLAIPAAELLTLIVIALLFAVKRVRG